MTSASSPRPVSALRARMIEDMTVRGFTEETHSNYIREVRAFAAFIRRPPDTATAEDLRRFQLHQTQSGMQPPSINSSVSALRFFFTVTLDRPDLARRLTVVRQPRRLPAVLSVEEITLLLQAAPGPKYKAAFATAYGAGLRVSEVVALKVGDIDSERMRDDAVRHGVVDTVADANCRLEDFIDAFQSGRNVHAITHHRVAQALGGADIAHDDIGAMQANAHAHLRTTIPSPLKVQPTDAMGSPQCADTGTIDLIGHFDRRAPECHHRIADKLIDRGG